MSEPTSDRVMDLVLKGFMPLLMVAGVLYGGYLLFDRMLDEDKANTVALINGFVAAMQSDVALRREELAEIKRMNAKLLRLIEDQQHKPIPRSNSGAVGGD